VNSPSYLSLDQAGVSGCPTIAGDTSITFYCSNGWASDTQTTIIHIADTNHTPVIDSISPKGDTLILAKDSVTFKVFAHDIDARTNLTYIWNGTVTTSNTFRFAESQGKKDTIQVRVTDGIDTVSSQWIVTVQLPTNVKPNFRSASVTRYSITVYDLRGRRIATNVNLIKKIKTSQVYFYKDSKSNKIYKFIESRSFNNNW
jgi:hypothetical protein